MSTTTSTAASINQVANVIIPVADQDAMVDFYTETLGLDKRADIPFGDGVEGRWVEVAPCETQTPIALCPPARCPTAFPSRWRIKRCRLRL